MESNYLIIIFLLLTGHYLFFLIKIYRGLNKLSYHDTTGNIKEYTSVIIPFRNESANILQSLDSIEMQNYPKERFEVIYINDNSTDDSLKKLLAAPKSKNIKVLTLKNCEGLRAYKKRAVSWGIENAAGEIIVSTDADCVHSPGWLYTLISSFDDRTAMAAGPVDFYDSQSLFGKIQKLEFQGLILAGAGLLGSGKPVICSAANLAYRRCAFDEVNGFSGQLNLSSGDDELLMHKIYRTGKYKIRFCANPDALVKTNPTHTFTDFFNQRKRWASKASFYKDKVFVIRLILIFLFYLSIPALAVISCLNSLYLAALFFVLIAKLVPEFLIMKKGNSLIFRSGLLKYFVPAELFQIFYILIASIMGLRGNINWKDRKLKR